MSFTLQDLASDLGIDVSTLAPDKRTKWDGYLGEADTKYRQATEAQRAAQETLEQAKREQQVIDENITKFGLTEANTAALRANNAALQAALEEVKKQGFNIDVPSLPQSSVKTVDPQEEFRNRVTNGFAQIGDTLNFFSQYQSVFGRPYDGDISALTDEAARSRMSFRDFAERKFDFAGERAKKAQAELDRKIQEGVQAGVKKYQEEHPVTAGNPEFVRGGPSRHPIVSKPREAADRKSFANLSTREKIAQSVSRSRAALKESA